MEGTAKKYYKYCIVPLCLSTTFKTPDKKFFRVPQNKSRRLKWLKACRRNEKDISEKSRAHVCEDHFNLEEDMDNYVKFKLMGGLKKMKGNVVPHIFDSQPDRKRSFTNHPRVAAVKRAKRRMVDEAIASSSSMTEDSVSNLEDLQIVASSSQKSTNSIHRTDLPLETSGTMPLLDVAESKRDAFTQVQPRVKSKAIQCKLHCGVTVGLSPIKVEMKPSTNFSRSVSQSTLSIQSSDPWGDENFSENNGGSCDYT